MPEVRFVLRLKQKLRKGAKFSTRDDKAHRAQVPSEDALPDKDVLEALLQEWWSLVKEVSMTRIEAATILNEEEVGDASQQKPQMKEDSPPKSDNDILQLNCFGTKLRHVHLREELINITKLIYLRSCLSGPALKAIEGRRGESWIFPQLSLVGLKSYTHDGAAQLTRVHDVLNRHFIQLNAHGKNVISGLNGTFTFTHFLPTFAHNKEETSIWGRNRLKGLRHGQDITSDEFLAFLLDQARIRESDDATRTKATLKKDKPEYEKRESELWFRTALDPCNMDRSVSCVAGII
ncbi:conserved hypothetical protein [Trichinella spiralis]|uniref:hypothetical protein n=1 Tax=Trichinella spiralis TaxID=6334 RepID=UPI0001EFC569|nr:conserved hypothetical protein [Trichinella spiralis]